MAVPYRMVSSRPPRFRGDGSLLGQMVRHLLYEVLDARPGKRVDLLQAIQITGCVCAYVSIAIKSEWNKDGICLCNNRGIVHEFVRSGSQDCGPWHLATYTMAIVWLDDGNIDYDAGLILTIDIFRDDKIG